MEPGRVGEKHFVAGGSKFVLDDHGLAADHVGGAVEEQTRGNAAGERAIDGLVLIIEGVFHDHLRRDGAGGFVDVVVEGDVGVRVDDARRDVFALRVNYRGTGGRVDGFTYGGDFAVLDQDGAVLDVAVGGGHDDGVLDDDVMMRRGGLREGGGGERQREAGTGERENLS